MLLNEIEVDEAVERCEHNDVARRAAVYLRNFMRLINSISDGCRSGWQTTSNGGAV